MRYLRCERVERRRGVVAQRSGYDGKKDVRRDAARTRARSKEEKSKEEEKKKERKKEKQQVGQTEACVKGGSSLFIKVNGRGYSPL